MTKAEFGTANAILRFRREHRHWPILGELARFIRRTPSTTRYRIQGLKAAGLIEWDRPQGQIAMLRMPYKVLWTCFDGELVIYPRPREVSIPMEPVPQEAVR